MTLAVALVLAALLVRASTGRSRTVVDFISVSIRFRISSGFCEDEEKYRGARELSVFMLFLLTLLDGRIIWNERITLV